MNTQSDKNVGKNVNKKLYSNRIDRAVPLLCMYSTIVSGQLQIKIQLRRIIFSNDLQNKIFTYIIRINKKE